MQRQALQSKQKQRSPRPKRTVQHENKDKRQRALPGKQPGAAEPAGGAVAGGGRRAAGGAAAAAAVEAGHDEQQRGGAGERTDKLFFVGVVASGLLLCGGAHEYCGWCEGVNNWF